LKLGKQKTYLGSAGELMKASGGVDQKVVSKQQKGDRTRVEVKLTAMFGKCQAAAKGCLVEVVS
jgi:hypothetical protein